MPYAITAADAESRIIAGRIVSWNAEGSTSAGRTMFKKDSITMAKNIKLVLQHDVTRPLGKTRHRWRNTGRRGRKSSGRRK
jgi:hypothetical protein